MEGWSCYEHLSPKGERRVLIQNWAGEKETPRPRAYQQTHTKQGENKMTTENSNDEENNNEIDTPSSIKGKIYNLDEIDSYKLFKD